MADLSSSAQAVVNAAVDVTGYGKETQLLKDRLAAALKALADQVVPWQKEPTEDWVGPTIDYGYAWALYSKANDIRQEILAIAAELEGGNG